MSPRDLFSEFDDQPPDRPGQASSRTGPSAKVLSVSQLTFLLKDLVEEAFPSVWVGGEISGLTRPQSGHCYFTLKDERAQVKAVVWRTTAVRLGFELKEGQEVIVRGDLEVYAPRGSYQLVVQHLEPRGLGARELALRQLKEKLAAEGFFASDRKRALPVFPRRVAIITSPSGAAVRDFCEILHRRSPGTSIVVIPVRVQGVGSAREIAQAIRVANIQARGLGLDVLVVGRGGGSLEDLWAFNEEPVARAIFASQLPVVSAVGHEIDVTLADLVADFRAATPSEAAERLVADRGDVAAQLARHGRRLATALRGRALAARARLETLAAQRAFKRPFERLHDEARHLDELSQRAERIMRLRVERGRQRIERLAARLEALSPLSVLGRGYSLTQREADGRLVRDAGELQVGDRIVTRFAEGKRVSRVEE